MVIAMMMSSPHKPQCQQACPHLQNHQPISGFAFSRNTGFAAQLHWLSSGGFSQRTHTQSPLLNTLLTMMLTLMAIVIKAMMIMMVMAMMIITVMIALVM